MIRAGKLEDFDQILVLCGRFWQETVFFKVYNVPFQPDHACNMVKMAYEHEILAVVEENQEIVGFAAGITAPLLGNGDFTSGIELAWWINPEHRSLNLGSKLFDFMQELAGAAGVDWWCMVSLQSSNPDKVNRFYEKKGYHLSEMTYMRCLWPQ